MAAAMTDTPESVPPLAGAAADQAVGAATPVSVDPPGVMRERLSFTGTGAEYFRIWVVNIVLTILTFGVYSAWAKVRRLQYFYRNTQLAGSMFDYHGDPKAILKGRILAVVLLGAYKLSYDVSAAAAAVVALIMLALLPWLLARAFRFKLANSSYRNLRFRFQGTVFEAYRTLILFPVILFFIGLFVWSLVTSFSRQPSPGLIFFVLVLPPLVIAGVVPFAHYLLKHYQHDHAYFGQSPFFFYARASEFFKIYGKAIGLVILGFVPAAIFGWLTKRAYDALAATMFGWLFKYLYGLLSVYVLYLFARPFLESRIQNLVWNRTELADHKFESTAGARKLLWIHASNLLLITLTFGLYKPFATIRIIRYRVENMALVSHDDLQEFLTDQSIGDTGASGQEAADFFDIDIAL